MPIIQGRDLKPGDVIRVWWHGSDKAPNQDTITRIYPYRGPLQHLWPDGARIAEFTLNPSGMTIGNTDDEELISRKEA